jgi:hypothetical protein
MNRKSNRRSARDSRAAIAMKIGFCLAGIGAGVILAKAGVAQANAVPAVAPAAPSYARVISETQEAKETCRQVQVQTNDGQIARWVCRKAL